MNSSICNIYIKNFCFLSFVDSVYNKHNLSFSERDCRYGIVAMGLFGLLHSNHSKKIKKSDLDRGHLYYRLLFLL
nr:MAG TPA: hypothetical protein [Caudoviricetes sp.]